MKAKRSKQIQASPQQAEAARIPTPGFTIDIDRMGEWMPVEQLLDAALAAVAQDGSVTVSVGGVEYLDTSALQVLLALDVKLVQQGRRLTLTGASQAMREWFGYAGAMGHLLESTGAPQ